MEQKSKEKKNKFKDPYKHIRRDIPPPGFSIGNRGYNKNKNRKRIEKLIIENIEENL